MKTEETMTAPVDAVVGLHDLFVSIDREHQAIDFQLGNQPFVGQWLPGMPGDGAIYRNEEGKVIGGFFPLAFRDVKINDTNPELTVAELIRRLNAKCVRLARANKMADAQAIAIVAESVEKAVEWSI